MRGTDESPVVDLNRTAHNGLVSFLNAIFATIDWIN